MDSKWKFLKNSTASQDLDSRQLYMIVCLQYRNILESVLLLDKTRVDHPVEPTQYFRLQERLEEFTNLKSLNYKRHSNDRVELFDSTVEKFRSITYLNIGIYPDNSTGPPPKIRTIDIKTVYAACVLDNDDSLIYFMYKFPRLDTLYVNTLRNRYEQYLYASFVEVSTYFDVHTDSLVLFLAYATAVRKHHVSTHAKRTSIINIFINYFSTLPEDALVPFTWSYPQPTKFDDIARGTVSLPEQYVIMSSETPQINNEDIKGFGVQYSALSLGLPHLEMIEKLGSRIKALKFSIHNLKYGLLRGDMGAYEMAIGYYLDHIFQYCPNVTHLLLEDMHLHHCNPNIFKSESVNRLFLKNVKLDKDILYELSTRIPSLKYLKMAGCELQLFQGGYRKKN